jgi:NDP-sugar pyrophosphorylase family protein
MVVGTPERTLAPLDRTVPAEARATVDAIVLCGTHWRRHAFAPAVPRPLLPVVQLPLVARTLGALAESAFTRASVCTNGAAPQMAALVAQCAGGLTARLREDLTPRGPAGCVRDAALSSDANAFLVVEGTVVMTLDVARLLEHHRQTGAAVTIVVQPADAAGGRIDAPAGIYVFSRSVIDVIPAVGFYDIKESLLPRLHRAGERCEVYRSESWCPRILDAQSYMAANHWVVCEAARLPSRHAPFADGRRCEENPDALVHPTAHVDDGALLVGPVVIGPGADVMRGATIVGPASIGEGCRLQGGALVSRSVLWERVTVGRDAHVDRSVVADDVTIEAGTVAVETVRTLPRRASVWGWRTATVSRPGRSRPANLANAPAR